MHQTQTFPEGSYCRAELLKDLISETQESSVKATGTSGVVKDGEGCGLFQDHLGHTDAD